MVCCFEHRRIDDPFSKPSCQLSKDGEQLIECDGKLYCEFHLPTHDLSEASTIKGRWNNAERKEFIERSIERARISEGYTDFSGIVFPTDFLLQDQEVRGDVWFISCTFEKGAIFDRSRFCRMHFIACNFLKGARFHNTLIEQAISFDKVNFGGSGFFDDADLRGAFICIGTIFKEKAYFRSSFDNKKSFDWVSFSHSEFRSFVTFENRVFKRQTDFSHCKFHSAPEFHGCMMHQDTNFDSTNFLDTSSDHAARAYRTLKLAMENVRARQEEADFFALEQKSLRGHNNIQIMIKVTSWLYEIFSDYGRNVFRPGLVLIASWLYFFALYAGVLRSAGDKEGLLGKSITLAVKQVVRPFWIWFEANEKISDATLTSVYLIKFFATIQSILSIVLIALFLLALRRQFKMD